MLKGLIISLSLATVITAVPIQVYRMESGKYRLNISALENIFESSADNEVAIYAIAGPLRLGKSFMMNYFLRYLLSEGKGDWISSELPDSFKSRGGVVRETEGIWMWDKPFVVRKGDGTKVSVFLIDTQGCFDSQTSNKENAIVFALSVLMSSVMIFNIKGQVDESILEPLQQYVGYAGLGGNDTDDRPFLQNLQFLIRDFTLGNYSHGYYDDNPSIYSKNYKKDMWNVIPNMAPGVKIVRQSIEDNFKHISFYLMPFPGVKVAQGSTDKNDMTYDFLHHLSQYVPSVLKSETIVAKEIGDQFITGAQLMAYTKEWAKLFESDDIPDLDTIFATTVKIQNQLAKRKAFDNYVSKMSERISKNETMSDNEFKSFHRALFDESCHLFTSIKCLGGVKTRQKYMDELVVELGKEYTKYSNMNRAKVESKVAKENAEKERIKRQEQEIENAKKLKIFEEEKKREKAKLEKELRDLKDKARLALEEETRRREEDRREYNRRLQEMDEMHRQQMKARMEADARIREDDRKENERRIKELEEKIRRLNEERRHDDGGRGGGGGLFGFIGKAFDKVIIRGIGKFISNL